MKRLMVLMVAWVMALGFWAGCQSGAPLGSGDALQAAKARGKLIVGVKYDSPPFGFLDADGQLKGMEIDLARALARGLMGYEDAVEFVQVNTSTRVAALNSGQVDFVLATMTITPERAKVVNFTEPYYKAAQGVMVKNNSPIKTLADLNGKTVMTVIGATGGENLKKSVPGAKLLGFKSSTEAFSAFYAGRGDAFSTDDSILYGFLHEYCGVRLLEERISEEPYGIAFRKDAESQRLQQRIQELLTWFEENGRMEALRTTWNNPNPPEHCKAQ